MSTTRDRITRVRFAGLRTAASVELNLEGLTVLIGPNAAGKSSLIEGLELLRRVMTRDDFFRTLHEEHGGPTSLVTHGQSELRLGADLTNEYGSFSYEIVLGRVEGGFGIARESLDDRTEMFAETGDSAVAAATPDVELRLGRPRESSDRLVPMRDSGGRVKELLRGSRSLHDQRGLAQPRFSRRAKCP